MIITKSQERVRFFRFAVVGGVGAIIDFSIFNLLAAFLGIQAIFAQVVSFVVAVCSNFIWNRYWTYPDSRSKPLKSQMIQFLLVSVIGLVIRTPLFGWLEPFLIDTLQHFTFPQQISVTFLGHNLALAFAIIVVMFWNFIANRFWTYNDIQ